ncbi:MAG TPA: spore coat protein CotH [Syntrophaceticus sp.]|jgi:spore coat protein H|nr:spore coat protein CotH [Syntrophaceticus sp.]
MLEKRMIENKYLNVLIVLLMIAAVLGTGFLMFYSSKPGSTVTAEPEYTSKIFNKDQITEINIDIKQEDFDWIIENAAQEEYRCCDITINGMIFKNVGIRPKGNSSLRTVAQDDNSDRFSFKVKFDAYIEGQTCFGLNKLSLNNIIMDKTYMKEYLAYDMFASMGVVTPEYAFTNIKVNGKPWGLYLAVEAMEESFVQRNYGSLNGHLYRPEGAGADLKWAGESAGSYAGIRKMAVYDVTDSDFNKIITMIEHLNNGTDLEKHLDVDSILRYFAVNTFLVNFDSYTGSMKHNYYLYEENGVCTILPWDFNLAFAGHQITDAEQAVNHPIDTPVNTNLSDRPLIAKLLEVPEYKELYHKYLDELVKSYISSGTFEAKVQQLDRLINSSVQNDATAFYTYEEYEKSLPVLVKFAELRAQSISAQLSREQPATSAEQSSNTTNNIDASGIDLSALGGMGGLRGKGGGMPGNPRNQGDAVELDVHVPGQEDTADHSRAPLPGGEPGGFPGARKPDKNFDPGGGAVFGEDSAGKGQGPDDMPQGNMLDQETMTKVREIMQNAAGGELSDEQISQLKELGLDENMIDRMKNMPAGMQGARREGFEGNKDAPDKRKGIINRITPARIAFVAVSTMCILLGLLFVWKFKRRKYSS